MSYTSLRLIDMDATCSSAQRGLLYNYSLGAERYWCPTLSPLLHSSLPPFSQQPLAAAFKRGVSFYVIGDSVAAQHFRSLACAVGVDSIQSEGASNHTPLRRWETCYTRADAASSQLCYTHGGSMVPHRHSSGLTTWTEMPVVTHDPALVELVASGQLRRGDVILLNEGVHFRQRNQSAAAHKEILRLQRARLESAHVAAAARAGARVVWRETLAQHFRTPDGLYPHATPKRDKAISGDCVPIDDSGLASLEAHNSRVNALVHAALPDARILTGLSSTARRSAKRHFVSCLVQNKSRPSNGDLWQARLLARLCAEPVGHGQIGGSDCTHYCEQSEPFQTLNAGLARLLLDGERSG